MIESRLLRKRDELRWNDFLEKDSSSTFFHQSGWKRIVEDIYHLEPYWLLCENEIGDIIGVLPIFCIKNSFRGCSFISVPYAPYGGLCTHSEKAKESLLQYTISLGQRTNARSYEFRSINQQCYQPDFSCMTNYSTFILDLEKGCPHIWSHMNKTVRSAIRKGEKRGLEFEIGCNDQALEEFYEIYSQRMRDLGTPAHGYSFFKKIMDVFKEQCEIALAKYKGIPVASNFLLSFKGTMIYGWGSSRHEFLKYAPNNFIHWNTIKHIADQNLSYYDLGRSLKNSGNYNFKKKWGAKEFPLCYYGYPGSRTIIPSQNAFGFLPKLWAKLPVKLASYMGPKVRKFIP